MSSIQSESSNQLTKLAKYSLKGSFSSPFTAGQGAIVNSSSSAVFSRNNQSQLSQSAICGYGALSQQYSFSQHSTAQDLSCNDHLPQIKAASSNNISLTAAGQQPNNNDKNSCIDPNGVQTYVGQPRTPGSTINRRPRLKRFHTQNYGEETSILQGSPDLQGNSVSQFTTPTRSSKSMKDELKDWLIGKGDISPDSLMKPTSTYLNASTSSSEQALSMHHSSQLLNASPLSSQQDIFMKRRYIIPQRSSQETNATDSLILEGEISNGNFSNGIFSTNSIPFGSRTNINSNSPSPTVSQAQPLPPINNGNSMNSSKQGFFDIQQSRGYIPSRKLVKNFTEIIPSTQENQPSRSSGIITLKRMHSSGSITFPSEQQQSLQTMQSPLQQRTLKPSTESQGVNEVATSNCLTVEEEFDAAVKNLKGNKSNSSLLESATTIFPYEQQVWQALSLSKSKSSNTLFVPKLTKKSSFQETTNSAWNGRRSTRKHNTCITALSPPKSILKTRSSEEDSTLKQKQPLNKTGDIFKRTFSMSIQRKKNVIFNEQVEQYVI